MTPAPKRARNPKTGETVVLVGGQWVPEPKAETQAPANAPAPAPAAPSQRRYDMQPTTPLEGLKRDVGRGLAEAGQGVLSAVTFGGDDEIAGGINAAMGGDYEAGRAKAEARKTALQARSKARAEEYGVPISSYGAGEFAGTVAQTAATGGLSQGGSLAARGARALGSAAGGGAAEGALNAQPGERVGGAARGAAIGAATAGVMKAPAKLVSSVAKHAPGLSRRADLARLRSVGINPAHADELPGGIEGTTETLRKHGVGKGILTGSGGMERQASAAARSPPTPRTRSRPARTWPARSARPRHASTTTPRSITTARRTSSRSGRSRNRCLRRARPRLRRTNCEFFVRRSRPGRLRPTESAGSSRRRWRAGRSTRTRPCPAVADLVRQPRPPRRLRRPSPR
jgi:hypothetical protein